MNEALGDISQAMKNAVAGRSELETEETEERLTKIEDALDDQRKTAASNAAKLDLIVS